MSMSGLRGDLEVRHCRMLVAVHEQGGIVAAARALGVAQSTVSEALLALERLLGVPVLQRSRGRGGHLTPAVEALLPHARALIAASEAVMAAFVGGGAVVRLGVVESVSSFLLPRPLSEIRKLWPSLDVQVSVGLCEDLRRRASLQELDAAITIEGSRAAADSWPGTQTLSPAHLQFVVAPTERWGDGQASRESLRAHSLLLADSAGAFNSLLRAWFGDPGQCPRLESAGSIDGVKRGVLAGDAVGVLPSYTVSSEISAGALMALRVAEPLPAIALYLTTATTRSPSPALQIVTAQIRQLLSGSAALA